MKRTTNINILASEERAKAWRPDTSKTSILKGTRKKTDTSVILDDRLMPYSRARSLSWADERRLVLTHVRVALKPQDILEEQACELIADQIMQLRMLDRFRALVLERARGEAISNLLVGRIENAHGHVLAMLKADVAARRIVEDALAAFGIPEEAIEAEAFMISIDEMERLSRMSAQAQIRLDLQLKQVERRRPIVANEIKALAHSEIAPQAHHEDQEAYDPDRSDAPDRSEPHHSAPDSSAPHEGREGSEGSLSGEHVAHANRGAHKDNAEEII